MDSHKDTHSINRGFRRIPGLSDEHSGTTLTIDGLSCSIADCVSLLQHEDLAVLGRALTILSELNSPTRSEAHTVAHALLKLTAGPDTSAASLAEKAFHKFLTLNQTSLEVLSIGAQWIRMWSITTPLSSSQNQLIGELAAAIANLRYSPSPAPRSNSSEVRYVLCRSFEVEPLRAAAAQAIHAILSDQTTLLVNERRVLAEQFLAVVRSPSNIATQYRTLRRLAAAVFSTGRVRTGEQSTNGSARNPESGAKDLTATNGDTNSKELSPRVRKLIDTLLADRGAEVVSRLMAQDYELIRKAQGLSLEDFRILTAQIRSRAASDPWARATLLDIVRAPHAPAVSCSVRTAVLGSLVSDARKIGRLSYQIEKEVLAISAEIPALPFLTVPGTDENEGENAPPRNDEECA